MRVANQEINLSYQSRMMEFGDLFDRIDLRIVGNGKCIYRIMKTQMMWTYMYNQTFLPDELIGENENA